MILFRIQFTLLLAIFLLQPVKGEENNQVNLDVLADSSSENSLFYMASYGIFNQNDSQRANISFYQNSPVTLGYSNIFKPHKKKYTFSSSAYLSTLVAASSNLSNKGLIVPPEFGVNTYLDYPTGWYGIIVYTGIDFENFTSLNLDSLADDEKIVGDLNSIFYITFGVAKNLKLFNKNIFAKISFSPTIVSQTDSDSSDSFSGYKFMVYLNYNIHKKWFVHSLLKYHVLTADSELNSTRIGFGFGHKI